jgi:hypothetical protein
MNESPTLPNAPQQPRPATDADLPEPEPRWPAVIAVIVIALLYLALPKSLSVGPRGVATAVVIVFTLASIVTHQRRYHRANHILGHLLSSLLTIMMIWSLVLLVRALPAHTEPPIRLLESAASLWITNILVFALWYWRLDGGGPNVRDRRRGHETGAFLFPQMTRDGCEGWEATETGEQWSPQFIDYLFLAFNTSTAFSPTDAPILSRWAKLMMIVQSCISLTVVVILAARAVNTL